METLHVRTISIKKIVRDGYLDFFPSLVFNLKK
jgi:hypothetical protein